MTPSYHGSAYLGPSKGRWIPTDWAAALDAAAGGLLDESHWVDLKQELPRGRTHNTSLAEDLAAFAIDGGLLVIGIEDSNSRAGKVTGVPLGTLADRIDQVARERVKPPLVVRSHEVPDPERPGHGCLFVHVPPSADAPHMVDYVYFGRGDKANIKLSDEQVRSVLEERRRSRSSILGDLRAMTDEDPIAESRQHSHIYLLARPDALHDDALVELIENPSEALRLVRSSKRYQNVNYDPSLESLHRSFLCPDGLAFRTFDSASNVYELGMIELVIREDGGLRMICGRGSDAGPSPFGDGRSRVLIPIVVLGLTFEFVSLAARISEEFASYQGTWQLGVQIDQLADVRALVSSNWTQVGAEYGRDVYERTTIATVEEMTMAAHDVTERLILPLLRGMGVSRQYKSN